MFMLSKPLFWPDLWRRIKLNIGKSLMPAPMGQNGNIAKAWAEGVSIARAQAFQRLGLKEIGSFSQTHAELVAQAAEVEIKSPESLGGGAGVDLIWGICESLQAKEALETGVAYGWSSLAILASISQRNGRLYSVDLPHPFLRNRGLTGAVVPQSLRKGWTLIREPDCSGLKKILANVHSFDFIHYDSDKSYYGRASTYRLLWPHLRPGGIMMSDDIADNTAFRDFAAEVEETPIIIYNEGSGLSGPRFIGLLQKR